MAENRRGRSQGLYYWSRAQLFILAAAFTVISVVVFFLGILIGQGIEERKLLKKEEPLIKLPAQPLPQGAGARGAPGKEEMTFYDTLAKAPSAAQPKGLGPATETKPAEKTAKPAGKETRVAVPEVKVASAEKVKTVEEVKEREAVEKPAQVAETKEGAPVQKASEAEGAKADTEAREKVWAVQVNAYPLERDAKNLTKKLKDKGYDAYVVSTNIKGRNWYRVRVGHLQTQEEAKALQDTLKAKEKFTKSITTSR